MKAFKKYEIPIVELIAVEAEDVLTSSGFDGEEHDLLRTSFFEEA